MIERVVKVRKKRDGRYNVKSNTLGFTMNVDSIGELEKIAEKFQDYQLEFVFARKGEKRCRAYTN